MRRILPWAVAALAALITGCASLPSLEGRTVTSALADTAETRLGRAVPPGVTANPRNTGIHALPEPHDAFADLDVIAVG